MNTDHAIRVKLINLLHKHGQIVDKELDIGEKIDEMVERIVAERDTAIRERDAGLKVVEAVRSYKYQGGDPVLARALATYDAALAAKTTEGEERP